MFLELTILLSRNYSNFFQDRPSLTEQIAIELIRVAETQKALAAGEVQLVDLRPSFDFAGGRIRGAMSLPNRSRTTRADQLDKSRRILFVSKDGSQGEIAARITHSPGFVNIANIERGFDAWLDAGYPIHTIDARS